MSAKKLFLIVGILILSFSLTSCAKKIVPSQLKVTNADKLSAKYPPTAKELVLPRSEALFLISYKGSSLNEARLSQIQTSLKNNFNLNGNFNIVKQALADKALENADFSGFQASNVTDALLLGKKLNATHVIQEEISILESSNRGGVDTFKAKVDLTIYSVNSGQTIIKKDFSYKSNDLDDFEKDIKLMVQSYFPLRGYILETRGGHQVAKISLGRSLGIKQGRKLLVRNREVKTELIGNLGITRQIIRFTPEAVAEVEVIQVMENEAWVLINKNDKNKIKLGQVVFTKPEIPGLF